MISRVSRPDFGANSNPRTVPTPAPTRKYRTLSPPPLSLIVLSLRRDRENSNTRPRLKAGIIRRSNENASRLLRPADDLQQPANHPRLLDGPWLRSRSESATSVWSSARFLEFPIVRM